MAASKGGSPILRLRLYVAGNGPNSLLAVANLRQLCDAHYPAKYSLEIVDLIVDPRRAMADGVVVTPTLLKLAPAPQQRLIGNLSNAPQVLLTLGAP